MEAFVHLTVLCFRIIQKDRREIETDRKREKGREEQKKEKNENQKRKCHCFIQPERQNRTYGYLLTVPSKRKKGCAVFEYKQRIWEIQAVRITKIKSGSIASELGISGTFLPLLDQGRQMTAP